MRRTVMAYGFALGSRASNVDCYLILEQYAHRYPYDLLDRKSVV